MFPKIFRVFLPIVLSLILVGCGALKVDSPNQQKKIELPPDVGSNKYSKKREAESNFFRTCTAVEKSSVIALKRRGFFLVPHSGFV